MSLTLNSSEEEILDEKQVEPETKTGVLDRLTYKEKVRYTFLFITTVVTSSVLYIIRGEIINFTPDTYKVLVAFEGIIIVWLIKMARIPLKIKLAKLTRGKPFTSILSSPGTISVLIGDTRKREVEDGEHTYEYDDGPRHKRELYGAPCNVHVEGKGRPFDLSVDGQERQYDVDGKVVKVAGNVKCPDPECQFHEIGIPYEQSVRASVVGDNPDSNLLQKVSRLAEHKGFLKATLKMERDERNAKLKLGIMVITALGVGFVIWNQNKEMTWIQGMFSKIDEFARSSADINNVLVNLRDLNQSVAQVAPGRVERIR